MLRLSHGNFTDEVTEAQIAFLDHIRKDNCCGNSLNFVRAPEPLKMFHCPYCATFMGRTFNKLLHHIKFLHSHEPNFDNTCGDCDQSFRKFASFKSNIHRKHRNKESVRMLSMEQNDVGDESIEDARNRVSPD